MSIVNKLLSEGVEEAGKNIAEKGIRKLISSKGDDVVRKAATKIPVSYADDVVRDVAVRNLAKNPYSIDDIYKQLVAYKKNPEVIKNAGQSLVEREATTPYRNLILDRYDMAFDNELGKGAGKSIDALRDYAKISTPQEFDAAKANMKKFLKSPDSDSIVNASKQYIDNRTPLYRAMNSKDGISYTTDINAALRAQEDGSDIVKAMSKDDRLIAPQFAERFNSGAPFSEVIGQPSGYSQLLDDVRIQRELNNAENYLPGKTLYHSSPNEFTKFDDSMLGNNTAYENTAFGHFTTPDEQFSKRFGNNVYEVQANIKNPITHPYGSMPKYSNEEANMLVEDWLRATDNIEGLDYFNQMIKDGDAEDLYDAYMNTMFFDGMSPFEYAADERKLLQDKGFDGIEIVEGPKFGLVDGATEKTPVSSYVALNGSDLDIKNAKKYLPVKSDDAAESIPVYTKNDFITDPSIFDDPAFADIVKNNNIENVMKKGTKNDLELVKRAKAGEVLTEDEIRNSRFAKNLGIDAKRAQLKYGNKLNITKAMEEGKEKVQPELEKRLRGMADQVLDRLHKDPNIKYDHKAVIFMGGPSSGKSSAGMKLYDAAKGGDYAVIDSDDIKPMFEEFGKGEGAGAVHLASAYAAKKMVLPDAAAEGMNLALPIVGKSDRALNYHLDLLKKAGYDVSVVDVSLPTDKAASRNFGRMMETNRNVEDTYVRNEVGQKPAEVYRKMVENVKAGKDNRVSGYAKISNDVKFGEPQILEEIMPSDVLKRVQDKFGKKKKK